VGSRRRLVLGSSTRSVCLPQAPHDYARRLQDIPGLARVLGDPPDRGQTKVPQDHGDLHHQRRQLHSLNDVGCLSLVQVLLELDQL
jgi:hypothetical protein